MTPLAVLYVDDDESIGLIVELALKLDGKIEPTVVTSAQAALDVLASDPLPDAILLDVMMPEIDGPSLLRKIREQPRAAALPVVFVTARTRDSDIAAYQAAGAAGIIVKPFDPLTLARTVREILATA